MNTSTLDRPRVARQLSGALDQVVAALIAVGDLPVDPTDDALDEVLKKHKGVRDARKGFRKALNAVLKGVGIEGDPTAELNLEAVVNVLVFNSTDDLTLMVA